MEALVQMSVPMELGDFKQAVTLSLSPTAIWYGDNNAGLAYHIISRVAMQSYECPVRIKYYQAQAYLWDSMHRIATWKSKCL